jgi:hypothetical protein
MEPNLPQKPNSLKSLLDSCNNNTTKKTNKGKTQPTKPNFDNEGKKIEGKNISKEFSNNINNIKNNTNINLSVILILILIL